MVEEAWNFIKSRLLEMIEALVPIKEEECQGAALDG